MKKRKKKTSAKKVRKKPYSGSKIRWFARGLAILYILFLGLFALDVFGQGYAPGELVLALLMHLIPDLVLIAALIVAWKCEKVGGLLFLVIGMIITVFFDTYEGLAAFLVVSLPVFVAGVLFLICSKKN